MRIRPPLAGNAAPRKPSERDMENVEYELDAESAGRQSLADTPTPLDPGLTCLIMLARFHGVAAEPAQLAHEFGEGGPFGITQILLAAGKLGLKAKAVRAASARLATTPLPALALGRQGGFFILARVDEDQALIHDPQAGKPQQHPDHRAKTDPLATVPQKIDDDHHHGCERSNDGRYPGRHIL